MGNMIWLSVHEDEWGTIGENTNWLMLTGTKVMLDLNNANHKVSRREFAVGTRHWERHFVCILHMLF